MKLITDKQSADQIEMGTSAFETSATVFSSLSSETGRTGYNFGQGVRDRGGSIIRHITIKKGPNGTRGNDS